MSHKAPKPFYPLNIAILTVSDTRTLAEDTSGQYLEDAVRVAGHHLAARTLLTDDKYHIRAQVAAWIADANIQVVLITGGTGFYGRDNTPEAVAVLFDKTIDGFGEAFRAASIAEIGMSTLQSRALAGMANRTAVFCMPGSTGACKTAWEHVLKDQLDSRTRPCNFYPHLTRSEETS
jgi:molybdenum cofactor biosynthesis protein B